MRVPAPLLLLLPRQLVLLQLLVLQGLLMHQLPLLLLHLLLPLCLLPKLEVHHTNTSTLVAIVCEHSRRRPLLLLLNGLRLLPRLLQEVRHLLLLLLLGLLHTSAGAHEGLEVQACWVPHVHADLLA
jgi:hypothetical protein